MIIIWLDLILIDKKKVDFALLADHRVKINESKKINKYLDLAREQKAVECEVDGETNNGP